MSETQSKEPLISIIFPVYNVECWVKDALLSVCAQTYRNLEILVINDGSEDSSRAICEKIAEDDGRIVIIDQENGGLSAARNTGIENARGDYIIFVDSDDLVHPDHVAALYKCAINHDVKIACTVMTRFENNFTYEQFETRRCDVFSSEDAISEMFYQGRFDSCAQAKIYARELWDDVRFPVGYLHEDLPTIYKVFLGVSSIAFFDSSTYGYRFNSSGINHSVTDDRKIKTLDLLNASLGILEKEHPQLANPLRCLIASYSLHCLLNAEQGSISRENEAKLKDAIVSNRAVVLRDKNARKKTRLALLVSFFGWGAVKSVYSLRRKR